MAILVAVLPGAGTSFAGTPVPLPRPRPALPMDRPAVHSSGDRSLSVSSLAPAPELQGLDFPAAWPGPSACELRLSAIAEFKPLPVLMGPGDCGASDVVQLEAVRMPDNSRIIFSPPTTLRCGMAEAVAIFVRQELAPSALMLGSPLTSLINYDSYECRGRNRQAGAKLSEHARGNALDIRGVRLANGRVFDLTDPMVSKDFRERMRSAACGRFTTVLGPGSDSYHENHIHLDLAERRRAHRMCQWEVREPKPEVALAAKPEPAAEAAAESKPAAILADVPLPQPRPAWLGKRRGRSTL